MISQSFHLLQTKQKRRNSSNVTGRHRGPKQKLRDGYIVPSLKRASHVAMHFHRQVWYRTLSLRYVHIRSSGIIRTP